MFNYQNRVNTHGSRVCVWLCACSRVRVYTVSIVLWQVQEGGRKAVQLQVPQRRHRGDHLPQEWNAVDHGARVGHDAPGPVPTPAEETHERARVRYWWCGCYVLLVCVCSGSGLRVGLGIFFFQDRIKTFFIFCIFCFFKDLIFFSYFAYIFFLFNDFFHILYILFFFKI